MKRKPMIDYLAKDYESFRQLMLDRLSATLPAWRERHETDLGVTIVEILAYVADHLSYFQDAVGTEAYLGTARQRVSVRRHARLLDYVVHEGCNARTFVHLRLDPGQTPLSVSPTDSRFVAARPATPREPTGARDLYGESATVEPFVFEPVLSREIKLAAGLNCLTVVETLRAGATSILVEKPTSGDLRAGDVVIIKTTTTHGSGEAVRHHPVMLTEDARSGPNGAGTTARRSRLVGGTLEIVFDEADAIPEAMVGGRDTAALGNNVLVDHGRWVIGEVSKVRAGRLGPLRWIGLTHGVPAPAGGFKSASAMTLQDPRQALPAVRLYSGVDRWGSVRPDLLGSSPADRHYCVELDDEGRAMIRFGDGACGFPPADGETFAVFYRVGNGTSGNVAAETINRPVGPGLDGVKVTNPIGAAGGVARESTSAARLLAPAAMRSVQWRAISAEDYERLAHEDIGVDKAAATVVPFGVRRIVMLAVDPLGYIAPSGAEESEAGESWRRWKILRERLLQKIEPFRRINHDVVIVQPAYVELNLEIRIRVHRSWVETDVLQQARQLLGPAEKGSFFHPDELTFGQSIHWSQIVGKLHGVPGVASVEKSAFGRADAVDSGSADRIEMGRREIPKLAASPIDLAGAS